MHRRENSEKNIIGATCIAKKCHSWKYSSDSLTKVIRRPK